MDTHYKGKIPTLKSKNHPLHGMAYAAKMPVASNDMLQSEAKEYLPPGAFIWRANVKGAWCVHFAPHKSHSESWAAHNHDSGNAMLASVRHVWQ